MFSLSALNCSFLLSIPFSFCFSSVCHFLYFCLSSLLFAAQCVITKMTALSWGFRLTGPVGSVWKPKKRPRCLASSLYNLVMHSLKVLEKHLHLVLLLSPVILPLNLFSSGSQSSLSVWKPRWFSLTGNVLQHSGKTLWKHKGFVHFQWWIQKEIRLIGEPASSVPPPEWHNGHIWYENLKALKKRNALKACD